MGILHQPTIAMLIVAVSCPAAHAEDVYKCVKDGKTSYLAAPNADSGQCGPMAIRDDRPDPAELARLLEQQKAREEVEKQANEAALKERELRAKELAAAAAARNARAAEESLRLQRQQPSSTGSPILLAPMLPYPPRYGGAPPLQSRQPPQPYPQAQPQPQPQPHQPPPPRPPPPPPR